MRSRVCASGHKLKRKAPPGGRRQKPREKTLDRGFPTFSDAVGREREREIKKKEGCVAVHAPRSLPFSSPRFISI